MDFSRPYSSIFRVYHVNPENWSDEWSMDGLTSASVTRSRGGMVESGDMTFNVPPSFAFEDGYYRVVMYTRQDGVLERHPIATLYCSDVSGSVEHGTDSRTITGKSVLVPVEKLAIQTGSYIGKGEDAVAYVVRLLRQSLHAPVESEGAFSLDKDYVFDLGSTTLDVVNGLLDAAGWCIQITESGVVRVVKVPSEPQLDLSGVMAGIVFPGVTYETDMSSIPNRYMASDSESVIHSAVNDDPDSPVSTVRRGFVIDADTGVEEDPMTLNGESIDQYCARRLRELSVLETSRSYSREYVPGLLPNMMFSASVGVVGLAGGMRVDTQTVTCGNGVTVSESAIMEVPLWT